MKIEKPNRYDPKYWIKDFIFLERKYGADRQTYLKQRGPLKPDKSVRVLRRWW